jgi:hypothetical protein
MPLSEHEQKLLKQMEQALYAEDPHFATRLESSGSSAARRRVVLGALGVLVGLALVFLGVMNALVPLGGLGFALMVAGAVYAVSPGRRQPLRSVDGQGTPKDGKGSTSAKAKGAGFMQRLEQRWDRRQHGE